MEEISTVTLCNGLVVGNFSSPHEIRFEDGSVLDACSDERVDTFSVNKEELEIPMSKWTDVKVSFTMTVGVAEELYRVSKMAAAKGIDIVLVSFPTLSSIKEAGMGLGPFRTLLMTDRITKLVSTSKFCC